MKTLLNAESLDSLAVGAAFGWGAVAASSLVLGMLLGLARPWPDRLIGLVLAFGAGALVSAVSFELFEEGVRVGGATAVGVGLGLGAVAYFVLARAVERIGPGGGSGGTALALGAFLDGVPEQTVLQGPKAITILFWLFLRAHYHHCKEPRRPMKLYGMRRFIYRRIYSFIPLKNSKKENLFSIQLQR